MNDAGKVAFTPKGDYSNAVTYEYLDTVVYDGNAYTALKTTTGNEPADDSEYWRLLARGGTSVPVAKEETTGVVKASSDIGVSDDGSMILETDYTSQESIAELTSGESRTTFFGKIAKAVSTLISHISTSASTSTLGHVKFGTSSGTACQGNDSRLSDSRTPKSHASTGTSYGAGSTSNYGHVKLTDSTAVTNSTGLALPATEKNASIEGTLANQISVLNTNLNDLLITRVVTCPIGLSFGANNNNYINIYPPEVEGYRPIMATLVSTNNSVLFCYGISQGTDASTGQIYFTVGLRNTSANALSNVKPVIQILYIKSLD